MHTIDQQIREAQQQGNLAAEAILRGQKAMGHTLNTRWSMAALELERAAELAEQANRPAEQAQILLALGKVLANVPERGKACLTALQRAAQLYQMEGDISGALSAMAALVRAHLAIDEGAAALWIIEQGLTLAGAHDYQTGLVDMLELRAAIGLLQLDWTLMQTALEQALPITEQLGDVEKTSVIREQLATLTTFRAGSGNPAELAYLQAILHSGRDEKSSLTAQLVKAGAAWRLGRRRKAELLAKQVLTKARNSHDPARFIAYLQASLLLANLADSKGDRPAVLAILLRCRTYLAHYLGAEVARAIDEVLNGLTESWGAEAMQAAIQRYQEDVAREGQIEA